VLEARDRVGGRILNHKLESGVVVEVGGQWVGPTQDRVLALADELGVGLFPTYTEGEHFLAIDGAVKRYGGEDFALPQDASADVAEAWEHLQQMATEVPLDEPWRATHADTWDAQTLDSWLVANAKTEVGLGYWRTMVPALFSAEAAEMSLLHFLFYCRSGGTLDRLVDTHGGAQESRLVGGSQQLALRLADRLGDAVRLGSPVGAIRQDDRGVEVAHDGGIVTAGQAIVALPPTLAGRIRYTPALPPLRDQLTQQVPMGYVTKVQIAYSEPFWRAEGLSAPCWRSSSGLALQTLRSTSRGTGRPKSGAGAATADASGPECGLATAKRFESPWAVSTGRARRPRRSGMATWTERYAPASAPPAKCSSLEHQNARGVRE
jgi:monoamine oxidase